jgi:steroid delta-isomerase
MDTPDTAHKVATVDRYVEAFEKKSLDLIREIFADTAIVEDPVGTDPHRGLEAVCEFYRNGFGSGARLELLGRPRCAGNSVAFPFQVIVGEMKIEVIDVFEFDGSGKVVSMKAYWGPENLV